MNNLIILETIEGNKRLVSPGRVTLLPGEKVVGFQSGSTFGPSYEFKKCTSCKEMGVYEST